MSEKTSTTYLKIVLKFPKSNDLGALFNQIFKFKNFKHFSKHNFKKFEQTPTFFKAQFQIQKSHTSQTITITRDNESANSFPKLITFGKTNTQN
jgi:hypothetical protein